MMTTANMLLIAFFLSGALSLCPKWSNLFMTTPQKMEALTGSCLQIPCNFWARYRNDFDDSETFGVWIKSGPEFGINQNNVIFNSSRIFNTYLMRIVGNLKQKNCTTLFSKLLPKYSDNYFFRIEKWPFRETALCDPLQITVKDSPPSPKLIISGDLKEKESVTITCSASTPCPLSPPKLTWNLKQDSLNNMEENPDKTFMTKIQEQITVTDKHDGYNITCSATYPVNEGKEVKTAEETQTLRVSYASQNPLVSDSPSDLTTQRVNLTCSSRANPPVSSFTWFKFGVVVYITVKILGIVMLYSTLIIFECWLRSRCCHKQVKDAVESEYVYQMIEV
ncbi:myelin-associated glycoprotein-like [Labrus bergylta]|uniref:myelin-associated glycoprotein-like n=1 Tax=Labrus bergylta TaxID=56723 RepID=UPI00331441F2